LTSLKKKAVLGEHKCNPIAVTKILLVEDHPELRDLLRRLMEEMGFTTIIAKNGKEGVDTAVAEKPDLILMNSLMPEMDGWEATKILRSDPETKDIPILAATAMFRPGDLRAWLDVGCNDYIIKPFTLDELSRKIRALIREV
jgi:two-component system, cell cycle response regulator DivK